MPKHIPRKSLPALLCLLLSFMIFSPAKAASNSAECKIDRATSFEQSQVSVGFPVHPDRYVGRTSINVLVASFELKDIKFTKDLNSFKERDLHTTELVSRLSRNKVKVNFIYTDKIFPYDKSLKEWEELKAGQHVAYGNQDEPKSTWGFVRSAIGWFDSQLDFSQIDTVVLQGPFDSKVASEEKTAVYEAFMTRTEAKGFFRPFTTNEKNILNAFVMSGTFDWLSYAHELLHNFGMTDLYDSTGKEPEPLAYKWSLFSSGNPTLFYWERWQLGWIDDSEVLCVDLRSNQSIEPRAVNLNYLSPSEYKMVVMRLDAYTAYVVELREPILKEQYKNSNRWNDVSGQALVTYSVKSDRWPAPIRLISQPNQNTEDDLSVGSVRNLGKYRVEVFDVEMGKSSVGIWSDNFSGSPKISELRAPILSQREARLTEFKRKEEEARKAEEERLKKEAEAKAAAEEAKMREAAKSSASPSPVASTKVKYKKVTITCLKGAQSKKITNLNPKCPKGFKKKL